MIDENQDNKIEETSTAVSGLTTTTAGDKSTRRVGD